jgi:uncharacterized protein YqeY
MMDDLKAAMKSGDKLKMTTIRGIQSAIKNKEIDDRVKTPDPQDKRSQDEKDDDLIIGILKTLVKQRKDSIEQFKAGGRQDLVDQESSELAIIETYLPQMMSKDQIESLVRDVITELKASSPKEQDAILALVDEAKAMLDAKLAPDGYNIGMNCGAAAGQTVMHLHVHLIPRYAGDMKDPRGGVRHVIPERGPYVSGQPFPPPFEPKKKPAKG